MMDPHVVALLSKHKSYFQEEGSGRIVCTLNNHSLPASRQALETFINGKKYAQLRRKADEAAALKNYEPFLLPSNNFPGQLYCSLTCQLMQAKLDTVKKHMGGKRFATAKAEFEKDERELMEEPELESSEDAEAEAEVEIEAVADMMAQEYDDTAAMEEDNASPGACPNSMPTAEQADAEVVMAAASKAGQKRKQQEASTHKLPRTRGKPGKRKTKQSVGT